jgi:hypothetical protein
MAEEEQTAELAEAGREIISFKLTKDDLAKLGQVATRLQVTSGVNLAEPGAFTIRNHSFSVDDPGAFVIRNHNFSTEKPGAYTIRNFRFTEQ